MNSQNLTRNPSELYDIYAPIPAGDTFSPLFFAGGAILCGIVILTLFFLFMRRKKEATLPYWEETLQKIDLLRPLQDRESSLYTEKMDGILRHYLETRFNLRPASQTTSEFFHSEALLNSGELRGFRQQLRSLFDQADMIKFAHLPPTREQLMQMEKAICLFVRQTAPPTTGNPQKGGPL